MTPRTASATPAVVRRRLELMGTSLVVEAEASTRRQALLASERAIAALEATEDRLSTWRRETELARVNATPPGAVAPLSELLAAELAAAAHCGELTGGAFDPAIGSLVEVWGLRSGGRKPGRRELAAARRASGPGAWELGAGFVRRLRPGTLLEEGGFGKGAGLDRGLAAAATVAGVSAIYLDLGGQVATWGPGRRWTVTVADPRDRARPVAALEIGEGSLATSGNSERGIEVGRRRRGHLLDPRTGRPARDFGSLTVWAPSALLADCLSTGLYVLGPRRALAWAAEHREVGVLVLATRGATGAVERKVSLPPSGEVRLLSVARLPRTDRAASRAESAAAQPPSISPSPAPGARWPGAVATTSKRDQRNGRDQRNE